MREPLTTTLWHAITPIYAAILEHPFITGLTDGSLPEPSFRFYVVQDALYLQDFARAQALAAAKAPRDTWCELFAEHAKTSLVVERALHEAFFQHWGLASEAVYRTPKMPANQAYTNYLLATAALGTFEEAIAALLPCYWIYWEVGKHLEATGSPNPLYQRWIETYASEEFGSIVQAVQTVMNEAAADLPESRRTVLIRHFRQTSIYEWQFWDDAYHRRTFPWLEQESEHR